jgi:hypothetical protein
MQQLRVVGRVAAAALGFAVTFLFVAITGLAGWRAGWAWAAIAFALPGAALCWWLLRRAASTTRLRCTAAIAVLGATFGLYLASQAAPGFGRVDDGFRSLRVPPELRLTATERVGNPLCLDTCPTILRRYTAPGARDEVAQSMARDLMAQGYVVSNGFTDSLGHHSFSATRGARDLQVTLTPAPSGGTDVRLLLTLTSG